MKTRYKIILVIVGFVSFYFAIIPILQYCLESNGDCTAYQELMLITRPVILSDTLGESIQWSGTVDGIEIPSFEEQITHNLPFVVSMVILPFVIIGFIIVWDRRK